MTHPSTVYCLCVLTLLLWSRVHCDSAKPTTAETQCRTLHHVDVDPGTTFVNSQCQLRCILHGKTELHSLNEGLACPQSPTGVCKQGECVGSESSVPGLGHIDIELVGVKLEKPAHAYATACIQNSSHSLKMPILNRANCVSCTTNVGSGSVATTAVTWNSVCAGSGQYRFVGESRVGLEVWDHADANKNRFVGGATVTVQHLIAQGNNHRQTSVALSGAGKDNKLTVGHIDVIITWTAL